MISHQNLQDVDLWELWIEFDQFNPSQFGMLHILGEITTDLKSDKVKIKKIEHENGQLVLQVPAKPVGRYRRKEVFYSEPVDNLSQYSSVCIYAGEELIACFDSIEILV